MGCPYAQGHLFAPARPPEDLHAGCLLPWPRPSPGDAFVVREFMRPIGIPARIER
jgi:hypothetical protein